MVGTGSRQIKDICVGNLMCILRMIYKKALNILEKA